MPISTFIFDFDGTILDTESQDFGVVSEMWQAHGETLDINVWRNGLGTIGGFDAYDALEATLQKPIDRVHWRAINHERYHERVMQLPLRPGVAALFTYAQEHNIILAVGSSADRAWVTRWLTHHQLIARFATVVTRDDVVHVKPSPEIFLTAAHNIGADPAQCVVFEDSAHGATAAARAGMRCVAVPIPELVDAWMPPATLRLRTLADIPPAQLIHQLTGRTASPVHPTEK